MQNRLVAGLQLCCKVSRYDIRLLALIVPEANCEIKRNLNLDVGDDENKFSVLIKNVHLVNDEERRVDRVRSLVRLKVSNQIANGRFCDSLYFSFISGDCIFIDRLILEKREFNFAKGFSSVLLGRKFPYDVVQTGSKVVDDLTSEHTESGWNRALLVILNRLKEKLVVVLGQRGIFAFFEKSSDFRFEITDVLIGPF
ncbi:MAG: hypothetical protein WAN65_31985 [Candidatus Sulfotelmatobacter sp.]